MRNRIAAFVLLLVIGVPPLHAQVEPPSEADEELVDTNESAASSETVTTSTSTTSVTLRTTSNIPSDAIPADEESDARGVVAGGGEPPAPAWLHLVRLAALAGPIAFLVLAWLIGAFVHYRLVRREQEQFPAIRGSRTPQTTPMIISAALFFVPVVFFVLFELRSRQEIRRGIGGVVDEWQPVMAQAWTALLVCLVLALIPWLFARRADTVA